MRLTLVVLIAAIAPSIAVADIIGRVVRVHDGDTLTVVIQQKQLRVRLDAVDAPELRQAFGRGSMQSLLELCGGKQAELSTRGKDRYGRTIAGVKCAGIDANAEQVRRGMAWVYTRYAPKRSPLYALERDARVARRGLWLDARPTAPWEWRLTNRARRYKEATV
jgi:endonuclease YncB( thermonuclease family)